MRSNQQQNQKNRCKIKQTFVTTGGAKKMIRRELCTRMQKATATPFAGKIPANTQHNLGTVERFESFF